jgi:hypothetical protein
MTDKEIRMLIDLREYVRKEYHNIEGKNNPLAQMRAKDASHALGSIVKSLDEILKNHVEFG